MTDETAVGVAQGFLGRVSLRDVFVRAGSVLRGLRLVLAELLRLIHVLCRQTENRIAHVGSIPAEPTKEYSS